MKRKPYVTHDERLAILQAVSDERKRAINQDYANNVASICAYVAMSLLCKNDLKVWNSKKGEEAYCKVLAVVIGSGEAKASFVE